MEIKRSGIILFAEDYEALVAFYRDRVGLPELFALDNAHSHLTCLDMGGSYLMIETGGWANKIGKGMAESPIWLRFNVEDVERAAAELSDRGIVVAIRREVWGTLADFLDPDGNRCSLRDRGKLRNLGLALLFPGRTARGSGL